MKKVFFAVLAIGFLAVSCGGGGGKAAPATDFTYIMSKDGEGVIITKYTGNGGKVVIPEKIENFPVVELGKAAFYGEDNNSYGPGYEITAVVIPASVKTVGEYCFHQIENLTSVTFLGTDVKVGVFAFYKCINLSELKFPEGEKVFTTFGVGQMAFTGCDKLPLAVREKLKSWNLYR